MCLHFQTLHGQVVVVVVVVVVVATELIMLRAARNPPQTFSHLVTPASRSTYRPMPAGRPHSARRRPESCVPDFNRFAGGGASSRRASSPERFATASGSEVYGERGSGARAPQRQTVDDDELHSASSQEAGRTAQRRARPPHPPAIAAEPRAPRTPRSLLATAAPTRRSLWCRWW